MDNIKKIVLILILIATTSGVSMSFANGKFTLSSNTFKNGAFLTNEQVYGGYGCTGKNLSPDLTWSNPPSGTKSYAVIAHDPDAPIQGGWYHWIVINMPSSKTSIQKNEKIAAPAVLTKTSFKTTGYGGPCPPVGHGKHRYVFTVYALNIEKLPVEKELSPDKVEEKVKSNAIGKASITAYYERK